MLRQIFVFILLFNFFNISILQYFSFEQEEVDSVIELVLKECSDIEGDMEAEEDREKSESVEEADKLKDYLASDNGDLNRIYHLNNILKRDKPHSKYINLALQTFSPPPEQG